MSDHEPEAAPVDEAPLRTFALPDDGLRRLAPAFQRGLKLRVPDGISVSDLLVGVLGVEPGYVRSRISTVFLDGSVVDDMETARLHQGSVLALSAAMPGLVGATLRKGGYYAAMRAAITLAAGGAGTADGSTALVSVKLFNLLIEELGPALLAHGVALPPAEARALLGVEVAGGPAGAPEVWLRAVAR
jgi:hypothetical protein